MKKGILIGSILIISIGIIITKPNNKKISELKVNEIKESQNIAMYQASDSGNYAEITKMPESGYVINEEKSYCKVNGTKDDNARLYTNENSEHVIANLQKNSKCYVWFDKEKMTSKKKLTELGLSAKEGPDGFTGPATTDEGLLSGTDDDGTTYYFRGAVTNNWVQFAGFYWRIIRINGDASIRLIYNGTSTTTTGTGTQISTSAYNTTANDNAYVGYMYGSTGASTYAATHANTKNSTIKGVLDTWYKKYIVDKGYSDKISTESGFCNDRKIDKTANSKYQGDGYGTNATAYASWGRLYTNGAWKTSQTPSFKCPQITNDLFTVSGSSKGNKKLTYPVGLITIDEIVFGGGFGASGENPANKLNYLYTNQHYWTMSPFNFYTNRACVSAIGDTGIILEGFSNGVFGVRPVINLASDVKLTGTGTSSDPYKVV